MRNKIIIHEKRKMCLLTLVFTMVILCVLRNFYILGINQCKNAMVDIYTEGYSVNGNLFTGTLIDFAKEFLLLFIIPMVFLAVFQYRESKEHRAGEFMLSLPVTKKQIFWNRTILGVLVYTIPWIVFSGGILLTRFQYDEWFQEHIASCKHAGWLLGNESMGNLMMYLCYLWCVLTLMYAVAVFVQNICSRPWIAGAIAVGMLMFPSVFDYCITRYWQSGYPQAEYWWKNIFLVETPADCIPIWDSGVRQYIMVTVYDHIVLVALCMILLAMIFFAVAYYMMTVRDASKNQGFIYIPWMREGIYLGISFSFVLYISKVAFEMNMGIAADTAVIVLATAAVYLPARLIGRRRMKQGGKAHE